MQNLSYLNRFSNFSIIQSSERHILLEMARKIRIEFLVVLYHFLTRGNNKKQIFKDASSITRMIHKIDDIINNDQILSGNMDKIIQVLQV
jgi:hypothetical protein